MCELAADPDPRNWKVPAVLSALLLAAMACASTTPAATPTQVPDRVSSVPANAVKMGPENDANPVGSYSAEYAQPVLLPGEVNTAGAEDSPFILPDGNTLYFFFSPDMNVPVEQQVFDGVTGIYVSHKNGGEWDAGERVYLEVPGTPSLDGCAFINEDVIWFCTVREGLSGMHWFTARQKGGIWQEWTAADFDPEYQVGELHMTKDGTGLYFHSARPGGMGGVDIWFSAKTGEGWGEPVNLAAVNSPGTDGWPALSQDETELWFYRDYETWRSKRIGDEWQPPEKMFGPLAGEPTLDSEGNVYFIHHYYRGDEGIEADVYVSYKVR